MQPKVIEKLESELLSTLFDYLVPFLSKKVCAKKKPESNLEGILNEKPKIGFEDIKQLESLLLRNIKNDIKLKKNSEKSQGFLTYSISLVKKNVNKPKDVLVSINYEESESGEKLDISIKQSGKEVYFAQKSAVKPSKGKVWPYRLKILYENSYLEERLSITYGQLKSYMEQHIADKQDMGSRVPLKWLNILPETMMGGVLGFTYLGENFMARRADLTGNTARMVDIHESIHTPDEYETRVLTSWILSKERSKYIK